MIDMQPVAGFIENWFAEASQAALAACVRSVAHVEGSIVEIGSWEGRSTIAAANAAWPRVVRAVDTWAGSPGEVSAELAAKRDVFARWMTNVGQWTKGNVQSFRMGWRDYVDFGFVEPPVALVFIDAEHTYREVVDTVSTFLPLMAPDGVICGDDAHHPPIRDALDELFGLDRVEFRATMWIHRVLS